MQSFNLKININKKILALGAELDTTFAYYNQGKVIISDNLGETGNDPVLLEKKINDFWQENSTTPPDYILTDLHPEYNSTKIGVKLTKQWQIPHIKIQHHVAHIFSVIAEHYLFDESVETHCNASLPKQIIGVACDGTGYGLDNTIWGGEVFRVSPLGGGRGGFDVERIAHLEPQTLLGGQLAVEEPARMLMAILAKFLDEQQLYEVMKKFYDQKTFKLLYSQLQQNFNCQITTSCGRVLDAASALLFGCNKRKYKHQAAQILEENSNEPYDDIELIIMKHETDNMKQKFILQTTPLFEYLVKKIGVGSSPRSNRDGKSEGFCLPIDKSRLAATVHQYIADGLWEIVKQSTINNQQSTIIFSGGMANNKIFRNYFENKKVLLNKKTESGDPGISLGQVGWFLLNKN